jgi:ribosomal protein L11 methyltransferase
MPYRVDLPGGSPDVSNAALDQLIALGALDVERSGEGGIAALMPDSIAPEQITEALGVHDITVSPAAGRDEDSVWILSPRSVRVGRLQIVPAHAEAESGALKLVDAAAFGTGLHPTTALCLEALDELIQIAAPEAVLDVGTGSGVLALGALMLGVPIACGIDTDEGALRVATENARINGLTERLQLTHGGPDAVTGTWPLVLANVLAAPLIEMAPTLVRRIGHHGRLVLSGIPCSLKQDVEQSYSRLGMRATDVRSRGGWVAIVAQASW